MNNALKWTSEEIEILRQRYPRSSKEEIANVLPRRSWRSIQRRASSLKIKRNPEVYCNKWTAEEEEILKKNYLEAQKEEILKQLSKRSWPAIRSHVKRHLKLDRRRIIRPIRKLRLLKYQKGYLAGLIDGEGTLWFKGSSTPALNIANTDLKVLVWCKNLLGMGHVYKHKHKKIENRKIVYYFSLSKNSDLLSLLREVTPYLIIKKKKAEEMISFLEEKRKMSTFRNSSLNRPEPAAKPPACAHEPSPHSGGS